MGEGTDHLYEQIPTHKDKKHDLWKITKCALLEKYRAWYVFISISSIRDLEVIRLPRILCGWHTYAYCGTAEHDRHMKQNVSTLSPIQCSVYESI
jgi:hypothetical protein